MTPTHTKKQVNVRAFVFNGNIDCLDQDQVNAKLIHGVKTLHTFDTKDYTANDWYIVN